MKQYIYDIFLTSTKNSCTDLTIALAMFLSDAREGKQQYGPDGLDYAAVHQDYEALTEADGELRRFIGRHYTALVAAYKAKDRAKFNEVVAQCEAKDIAHAEQAVQEQEQEQEQAE